MTEQIKIECYKCKKLLADNLVLPKGLCVYCAADEADQLPQPQKQEKKSKKEKMHKFVRNKSWQSVFCPENVCCRFVEKFNPDYQAGWVHKDICKRLEKFSQDVADKKSPRLCCLCPLVMVNLP